MWALDKKKKKLSPLARFRGFIQAGATLLTNLHLPNFAKGALYQGGGKYVCVPGLNCYSCPGAAGACPVGAFQAVVGSSKFRFSYYITGILILFGVLLGRFICGFLCPFGCIVPYGGLSSNGKPSAVCRSIEKSVSHMGELPSAAAP